VSTFPVLSEIGNGIGWGVFKAYEGGNYVANGVGDFIEVN
jgi:hypothetical protein